MVVFITNKKNILYFLLFKWRKKKYPKNFNDIIKIFKWHSINGTDYLDNLEVFKPDFFKIKYVNVPFEIADIVIRNIPYVLPFFAYSKYSLIVSIISAYILNNEVIPSYDEFLNINKIGDYNNDQYFQLNLRLAYSTVKKFNKIPVYRNLSSNIELFMDEKAITNINGAVSKNLQIVNPLYVFRLSIRLYNIKKAVDEYIDNVKYKVMGKNIIIDANYRNITLCVSNNVYVTTSFSDYIIVPYIYYEYCKKAFVFIEYYDDDIHNKIITEYGSTKVPKNKIAIILYSFQWLNNHRDALKMKYIYEDFMKEHYDIYLFDDKNSGLDNIKNGDPYEIVLVTKYEKCIYSAFGDNIKIYNNGNICDVVGE